MELVETTDRLWDILSDDGNQVYGVIVMTDEMVLVKYRAATIEFEECATTTNVVIAAFTTAHARLKLYSYMHILGERVLYTDTGYIVHMSSW